MEKKITIMVYIDDGRVYEYDVTGIDKAREHASAICKDGYRHNAEQIFEHYPSHRILKVKVLCDVPTLYHDRHIGT